MRLTKEVRSFIREEIAKKAQVAIDALETEAAKVHEAEMRKYESFKKAIVNYHEKEWRKLYRTLAADYGLTVRDDLRNDVVTAYLGTDAFAETFTVEHGWGEDRTVEYRNPQLIDINRRIEGIRAAIGTEFGKLLLSVETGAKRGSIEELLAGIKF